MDKPTERPIPMPAIRKNKASALVTPEVAPPTAPAEVVAAPAEPAKKPARKKAAAKAEPEAVAAVEAAPAAAPVVPVAAVQPAAPRPTEGQVRRRAAALYRSLGSTDAFANWLRAEREVGKVVDRAFALYRAGSTDSVANWYQAEAELDR
jgi:hypothetical protein